MSKRKIAAMLAATSAVGIINSGTSVAFATEVEINTSENNLNQRTVIKGPYPGINNTSFSSQAVNDIYYDTLYIDTTSTDISSIFGKVSTTKGGEGISDSYARYIDAKYGKLYNANGVLLKTNGYLKTNDGWLTGELDTTNRVYSKNGLLLVNQGEILTGYVLTGSTNVKDADLRYANETKGGSWGRVENKDINGWHTSNVGGIYGKRYFLGDGKMAHGKRYVDGKYQFFDEYGVHVGLAISLSVGGNVTIAEGQAYDVMKGVTSKDAQGNNGNAKISTDLGGFDPSNPQVGTYTITYTLTDGSQVEKATKKITVKAKPVISGVSDITINAGTKFNALEGVTAIDSEGVEIQLDESNVKYSEGFDPNAPKVGNYTVTYTVTDKRNFTTEKVRNVRVIKRNGNAPTIHGVDNKTINVNEEFDPMHGVVVDDIEDNPANVTVSVTGPSGHQANASGKYTFADEGQYTFTYTATDLDGNETVVQRVITVKQAIDTLFRDAVWSSNDLIMTGKMDVLGTTADANMTKTIIVRDSQGQIVKTITTTNRNYNDGQTGFEVDFTKTDVFDGLKAGESYNVFVRGTLNGKTYEEPLIQSASKSVGVTNINDLAPKEFNDYKITFRTGANNQIQIVKANLADTQKPVINAPAVSVVRGDSSFNLKDGVTITDNVDSQDDLLARLEINEGNFDINQAGTYEVTYTVRDAAGNVSETVTRTVTVTPKTTTKPTIKGATDVSIVQGTAFNSKEGVTAESSEGEDLTSRIKVNGTVNVDQVGEQTITYTVTDRDNNTTTVSRKVTVTQKPAANKLPTINAPMRHEIYVGDNFDPLAIATAEDPEDGPIILTEKNIVFNKVNTQKPGEYQVKYEVTDTAGARRSKVITVVVKQRPATSVKPTITFPEKTVIQVGESFDPIKDVTATDYKGNPITVEMKHVSWNKVDTSKPGDYQVKYTVSDSEGNTKIAYRTVTVEGQAITSKKPTIEYASNVVQTGTVFDPLAGVTAKDYKGQIINLTMSNVSWNKVDTNTPGTYQVKYTVVDSEGNRQIFYRDVTVQGSTVTPPSTDKKPVISFQDNIEISVGDVFNPLDGVTATDYNGQDIALNESNIAWNKVDTTKAGTYQVKYVVRDSEGNQKIAYRTVIVKGYTGLRGTASLQSVTIDKNTNTLRVIGNVDSLIHVVNDKESNVATIDSDVKYYLVAKDANGNEIFKNYMVRMNNGGSNSGFKVNNLSNEELNKIQEGNDVTLSIVVETLGTKGELTLNAGSLSAPVELVDTARNVKYTTYSEGNKVKISKSQNTVTLSEAEKVEVEAIEEAPKSEEVIEENTVAEEVTEEVIKEENTAVEVPAEEVIKEENAVVEEATEEAKVEVISDEEILELESELLLEGDLIIE